MSLTAMLRERPMALVAWLFAFALAMPFIAGDLARALGDPLWQTSSSTIIGRDFVNVFTAGQLVLRDGLAIIYDVEGYRAFQAELTSGAVRGHNYSYSPVSFFYVGLFALAGYIPSYLLWLGLTGAAFVAAARPYLREAGLPAWAALAVPASLLNIWAGHYGFLFGALWLWAWRLVDSHPRRAGILVGLMIVKPHLALLMPLALVRRRAWTPFLYAGLTSLALVVLSGAIFGWQHWATYLTHTSAVQASMIDDSGAFFLRMMPTIFPTLTLAGAIPAVAWLAQGSVGLIAIAMLWKWLPADPAKAGFATAIATFLVLPYAFNYDMTVVGLAALVTLHGSDRTSPVRSAIAASVFLLPLMVVGLSGAGLPLAPIALLALLAIILRNAPQESARDQAVTAAA